MNIKNLKVFNMPKAKSKLFALTLAGALMTTSLTGCSGGRVNAKSNILLTFGNITYSMEINGSARFQDGWIRITLADGSKIYTNEKNIINYNQNSDMMNNIAQQDNIINVETIQADGSVKNTDTILLLVDGEAHLLEISKSQLWSDGLIEITLADGSKIYTNDMNVIAFNSNSKMMEQVVQEKDQSLTLVP